MKIRLITLILSLGIVGVLLTGCGGKDFGSSDKKEIGRAHV